MADPQAPALVRAAREQAGELDQLITDLLDVARYHESAPHRETVRLDLLTSEAVHRMRQRPHHAAQDLPRVFERFYRAPAAQACPARVSDWPSWPASHGTTTQQ